MRNESLIYYNRGRFKVLGVGGGRPEVPNELRSNSGDLKDSVPNQENL